MLRYNAKERAFVLFANTPELYVRARDGGWNWPAAATHPPTFWTSEPYAALEYLDYAAPEAAEALAPLAADYRASFATRTSFQPLAPEGLEPFAFQPAGVEYCLNRPRVLIGDEPGLGKTIQAILLANSIGARNVLCVVPGNVRLQWREQILRWSTIPKPFVYVIEKSRDGVHPTANYVIVSYNLAHNEGIFRALMARRWDLIVGDELHYAKTIDSRRTRALFGGGEDIFKTAWLTQNTERVLGLTGTPLPNRPREAYVIGRSLAHETWDWMSYDKFCFRFNPASRAFGERVGRLGEFRARLRCNIMVRRLTSQVLPDLPEARYEITPVDPTKETKEVMREELKVLGLSDLKHLDPTELKRMLQDADTAGAISTLRRQMGEAMAPAICSHVEMMLDGGVPKIVVFAYHRSVMDELELRWAKHGVETIRGGMTEKAKYNAVQRFKMGRDRVFLAQTLVGGLGLDGLQHASSHAIIAEASWVPGDNEQVVRRLRRIGQESPVLAQFLVVRGSLSEYVLGRSIQKDIHVTEALDGS